MSAVDIKTEKVGNTMTQREFYNAVITVLGTLDTNYVYKSINLNPDAIPEGEPTHIDYTVNTDELAAFAQELINKLDKKNSNRKNSTSPKQKANADLKTEIVNYMTENPNRAFTAKELADKYTTPEVEITTQRISALMKQLVDTGTVTVFKAKDTKKNMVNWYQVMRTDEEIEETEEEE